ncbi:MAG: sporulation protein [Kofleriaceae bacterium]
MGFFDKLGAGGGKITVDVEPATHVAGNTVRGTITFTGGKRAQKVTALLVWLTRGAGTDINLGKGAVQEKDGESAPLGEKVTVTGELMAQPGQAHTFAFELPIPTRIMNSRSMDINGQPGPVMQHYRVWGTADIPGEIDKHGQSTDFEVTGGLKLEVTTR